MKLPQSNWQNVVTRMSDGKGNERKADTPESQLLTNSATLPSLFDPSLGVLQRAGGLKHKYETQHRC